MSILGAAKSLVGAAVPVAGPFISFVTAYWKPILCVLALLTAYWAGEYRESENCAAAALALKEKQEQAVIDQQVKVIAGERAATGITTGVSNDYENQISVIDKRYAVLNGLRGKTNGNPVAVSGIPATAGGYNGSTENSGFALGVRRFEVERTLDQQAQRLISCQAWIKEQGQARGR